MTEPTDSAQNDNADDGAESLAEVSARRLAARTQWQKALARARDRFAPANLRDEALDAAAERIGTAADSAAGFAWAHRGKIALAGLLGGLFLARKPIARNVAPLAEKAKQGIEKTTARLRDRQP
ncbi:hypothetical protein C7451_11237 [Blastomonas natatoria]|uniref:DUF3618 domain-containing protein n=1 Tax=Blastomonas natatoria TaxID=34015 RepID=A0A2V3UTT2_9SPHN|nr:hypothetical protein [Blastomonas natatoria]PXW71593.1 hypothetical protein C7451_11237 [Blastomonas natatoria]